MSRSSLPRHPCSRGVSSLASALMLAALLAGAGCAASGARPGDGAASTGAEPTAGFDELWVIATDAPAPRTALPDPRADRRGATLSAVAPGADGAEARQALPLVESAVDARISGPLASVELRQRFRNPRATAIDADYRFPMPPGAVASDFVLTLGARRIRGVIREREEAARAFAAASRAGCLATMLDGDLHSTFTQRLRNLEPGAEVDIAITFSGPVASDDGWLEWRLPDVAGTVADRSAPPALHVHMAIDAGTPILALASPSHRIETTRPDPGRAVIRIAEPAGTGGRDVVIRWQVAESRPVAVLMAGSGPLGTRAGGHFLLAVFPARAGAGAGDGLRGLAITDWGFAARDVLPQASPEPHPARPILLAGRIEGAVPTDADAGGAQVTWRGAGGDLRLDVPLTRVDGEAAAALGQLWARMKIAEIELAARRGEGADTARQRMAATALEAGIVSPWTAFLAIDATGER